MSSLHDGNNSVLLGDFPVISTHFFKEDLLTRLSWRSIIVIMYACRVPPPPGVPSFDYGAPEEEQRKTPFGLIVRVSEQQATFNLLRVRISFTLNQH